MNGKRIDFPTLLAPGDMIGLGTSAIEVRLPPPPSLAAAPAHESFLGRQLALLARRSIVRTFRDPGNIAPAIIVLLFLFVVVSAGFEKATHVKGFPTDVIWTFTLKDRLRERRADGRLEHRPGDRDRHRPRLHQPPALTPMKGFALIAAQLAGTLVLGLIQALIFLGAGAGRGRAIRRRPLGAVVMVVLFLTAVLAFGAFGILVGLWTGSVDRAVQAIAPVMTVFLFLSSTTSRAT